jgi:integrase
MADDITTSSGRDKLTPRRPPYWRKLSSGQHLGFRKMSADSPGSWIAQAYDPAMKKQVRRSLGAFDRVDPGKRFDVAKAAAEDWFRHLGAGGSLDTFSVRQCCEDYVEHIRDERGDVAAGDIAARFRRWVYADKALADVALPKLTARHVQDWRKRLRKAPVVIDPFSEAPRTRERAASSINRDMTALRAALNYGHRHSFVTTDAAWRVALLSIENAGGRRDIYLDLEQRRALIEAAPEDLRQFLRGLSMMPLRPGALAALTAGHFDKRQRQLTIGEDKSGKDRRIKLPPNIADVFEEQTRDKLPSAPLFGRRGALGLQHWDKDSWKKPLKVAAAQAGLPEKTVVYNLRHSTITDLVTGGLDLLTIAQLSGTSVAMIERHYGHLRADHAAAALSKLYV